MAALDRKQSASFRDNTIGFIFQDFNLIPVLTVYENIEYPLLMVQNTPTDLLSFPFPAFADEYIWRAELRARYYF